MEHIIQFGVSVDDKAIERMIVEKASEKVIYDIKRFSGLDRQRGSVASIELRAMFEKEIKEVIGEHKEKIIKEAVKTLVENLHRTKKAREYLEDGLKKGE